VTNAVVVGGGLAGITAALELADAGARVTLLETRSRLGGATFSVERDGLWIDNGQHVFLRCCVEYRNLLDRLGVSSQTVLQERLAIPVLRSGRAVAWLRRSDLPAPLHLGAALARFGPLSAAERLRVGRAVRALRGLSLDDPSLDERTFADFLAEHGQSPRAISGLWDLITLPTVNLPAAEASLALAAKVFKTGVLEETDAADVGYPVVPLQQLHGAAAERALAAAGVEVCRGTRARSLSPAPRGTAVAWDGGVLEAETVVLAVPHDDAGALLGDGALAPGTDPSRLGVSPIVNLHVVYDRPVSSFPFAAALETPVQWVFDRTGSAGLAEGQYLAVSLSGAAAYLDRTVEDLQREFVPALEALFPAARNARLVSFFVTREPRATFRGVPGTAAHRPGPRTRRPGVYLAGAWTDTGWPATMEGAVRSGRAAARTALADAGRPLVPEVAAA
jgi:squalene-associated FAD-dependent desaturase